MPPAFACGRFRPNAGKEIGVVPSRCPQARAPAAGAEAAVSTGPCPRPALPPQPDGSPPGCNRRPKGYARTRDLGTATARRAWSRKNDGLPGSGRSDEVRLLTGASTPGTSSRGASLREALCARAHEGPQALARALARALVLRLGSVSPAKHTISGPRTCPATKHDAPSRTSGATWHQGHPSGRP